MSLKTPIFTGLPDICAAAGLAPRPHAAAVASAINAAAEILAVISPSF
jgi:hypothetical protein